MAGAGYKLFSTGDVLSASDVNTYLQQQTVMVFASAAARTTALSGVLAEGMVTYLKDTDVVEIYTGAAWVSLDDPNAIQNSLLTAKGSIVTATGASTPSALAVGANNTVLTADSSTATGLKWATAAAGGKVLQVVQGSQTGIKSSASSTYADTDLTATITPSATSSKILVIATHEACGKSGDTTSAALQIKLMRGATEISNSGDCIGNNNTAVPNIIGTVSLTELDSPATTSATTYKTQFRSVNNNSAAVIGNYFSNQVARNTIILMEIGA